MLRVVCISDLHGQLPERLPGLRPRRVAGGGGMAGFPPSWTYLQDAEAAVGGLRIYGSPATPPLAGWAFELSRELLADRFTAIPEGLDLLVTHRPAQGILDVAAAATWARRS